MIYHPFHHLGLTLLRTPLTLDLIQPPVCLPAASQRCTTPLWPAPRSSSLCCWRPRPQSTSRTSTVSSPQFTRKKKNPILTPKKSVRVKLSLELLKSFPTLGGKRVWPTWIIMIPFEVCPPRTAAENATANIFRLRVEQTHQSVWQEWIPEVWLPGVGLYLSEGHFYNGDISRVQSLLIQAHQQRAHTPAAPCTRLAEEFLQISAQDVLALLRREMLMMCWLCKRKWVQGKWEEVGLHQSWQVKEGSFLIH